MAKTCHIHLNFHSSLVNNFLMYITTSIEARNMIEAEAASITSPIGPQYSKIGRAKSPTSSPPKPKEKSVDNKSAAGSNGKTRRNLSILSKSSFLS